MLIMYVDMEDFNDVYIPKFDINNILKFDWLIFELYTWNKYVLLYRDIINFLPHKKVAKNAYTAALYLKNMY